MMLFVAFAAVAALATGLLLYPLLRRPPEPQSRAAFDRVILRDRLSEIDREVERGTIGAAEAEASRLEVQRRLLATEAKGVTAPHAPAAGRTPVRTAVALAVLVPLGGLSLYLHLGAPEVADPGYAAAARQSGEPDAPLDQLVGRLAERMRERPDDPQGWRLLARSYGTMGRFEEAADAYRKALAASDGRPDIASDFGEMLYAAAGSVITPEAKEMFEAALAGDPFDSKARFYLALAMAEAGAHRDAIQAWTDLIALSPADAPWVNTVREQIKRVAAAGQIDPASIAPSPDARRLAGARPSVDPASAEAIVALPEAERAATIRAMVEQLSARLEESPNDREGWLRLARAYDVLGEPEKAKKARARAAQAE